MSHMVQGGNTVRLVMLLQHTIKSWVHLNYAFTQTVWCGACSTTAKGFTLSATVPHNMMIQPGNILTIQPQTIDTGKFEVDGMYD